PSATCPHHLRVASGKTLEVSSGTSQAFYGWQRNTAIHCTEYGQYYSASAGLPPTSFAHTLPSPLLTSSRDALGRAHHASPFFEPMLQKGDAPAHSPSSPPPVVAWRDLGAALMRKSFSITCGSAAPTMTMPTSSSSDSSVEGICQLSSPQGSPHGPQRR